MDMDSEHEENAYFRERAQRQIKTKAVQVFCNQFMVITKTWKVLIR